MDYNNQIKMNSIVKVSPKYNKDFAIAFQLSLELENFKWINKLAITVNTTLEGIFVSVNINIKCFEVIIFKVYMSRLRLVANIKIDFILNTADGIAKKSLIFKK